MNKKLLIAAVGAALVAGVSAAQADVKVSGYGHMSLDSIKGCKASGAGCTENSTNWDVSSNATNVVISANEDLGNGLKGIFQWQEFVRLDNNNTGNGALSGGNSAVGLGGDWGSVLLGNWDSGAKQNGSTFDLFRNQIGDSRDADVNNNRVANLLAYVSPNWGGFSGLLAHSTNTDNTNPTFDTSTEANSLMAKFEQGPLTVGVGYDKLSLGSGVAGDGDKWTNIGGKYTLPTDTTLILFYQKHDNLASSSNLSAKTWGLGVAQKFGGNNVIKLQYYTVKGEDDTTGADVKNKLLAVGFDHNFSKTFTGYVAYAQAKNDSDCTGAFGASLGGGLIGSCMSMAAGGHGDNPGTADGEKMSGFSFGAIYKF